MNDGQSHNREHARSMDHIYRYQRHVYDLTRKFYLLGRDRLVSDLAVPAGGAVIEIGCGTGRNLIRIARAYPYATLYGLDISDAMLATARRSIARARLSDRIIVAQGDGQAFDPGAMFGRADFDRVVMSYTLSMIPDLHAALDQGVRVLALGGTLHCVDFGQQEGLPPGFKRLLHAWLARFDVTPPADLRAALVDAARTTGADAVCQSIYRGYSVAGKVTRKPLAAS